MLQRTERPRKTMSPRTSPRPLMFQKAFSRRRATPTASWSARQPHQDPTPRITNGASHHDLLEQLHVQPTHRPTSLPVGHCPLPPPAPSRASAVHGVVELPGQCHDNNHPLMAQARAGAVAPSDGGRCLRRRLIRVRHSSYQPFGSDTGLRNKDTLESDA